MKPHRLAILSLLASLFLLALSGCSQLLGSGTGNDSGTKKSIFAEAKSIALKINETRTFIASATNGAGDAESISPSVDSAFATAAATTTGFSVKGVSQGTTTLTLSSASGLTLAITVNVFDPQVMDIGNGLLLRFTYNFDFIYNDVGSGGSLNATYWHPKYDAANGWYPVGSYIQNDYRDVNIDKNHVAVLVKDVSKNHDMLAKPTDYTLIYNNVGAYADMSGSIWKPVAPAGYVAMGFVVNGASGSWAGIDKPSLDCIRCVKKEYTVPGKVGDWIYDDRHDGGDMWLTVWSQIEPDNYALTDGTMFLLPGTNLAAATNNDPTQLDSTINNVFLINVPIVEEADNSWLEPKLTGYAPYSSQYPRVFSSVRVPYTMVTDPSKDLPWKIDNSPFYFIQRRESYSYIQGLDNRQATTDNTMTYSITTGCTQEESNTFTKEFGMKVVVGGSASFLGTGGKWSLELSTKLSWQKQTSTAYASSETKEYNFTVPKGEYVNVIQVTSDFIGLDSLGRNVENLPMGSNMIKFLQYP